MSTRRAIESFSTPTRINGVEYTCEVTKKLLKQLQLAKQNVASNSPGHMYNSHQQFRNLDVQNKQPMYYKQKEPSSDQMMYDSLKSSAHSAHSAQSAQSGRSYHSEQYSSTESIQSTLSVTPPFEPYLHKDYMNPEQNTINIRNSGYSIDSQYSRKINGSTNISNLNMNRSRYVESTDIPFNIQKPYSNEIQNSQQQYLHREYNYPMNDSAGRGNYSENQPINTSNLKKNFSKNVYEPQVSDNFHFRSHSNSSLYSEPMGHTEARQYMPSVNSTSSLMTDTSRSSGINNSAKYFTTQGDMIPYGSEPSSNFSIMPSSPTPTGGARNLILARILSEGSSQLSETKTVHVDDAYKAMFRSGQGPLSSSHS
jgi:hypothetical protein